MTLPGSAKNLTRRGVGLVGARGPAVGRSACLNRTPRSGAGLPPVRLNGRNRPPADFARFATNHLVRSRKRLHEQLGAQPTLLAWPFRMTDDALMALAAQVRCEASFALGNRDVSRQDALHALPRHLMTDVMSAGRLARLLEQAFAGADTR